MSWTAELQKGQMEHTDGSAVDLSRKKRFRFTAK